MKQDTTPLVLDITQLENSANRLRSLAHPMRIAILELLRDTDKLCVTEIYTALKLEQAVTSNHLNILKERGILSSHREGKKIFYSVKTKALNKIVDCLVRCNTE